MTNEQLNTAFRRYLDDVLRHQEANLDGPQIREVMTGLADDPDYVSPYPLREGQAAEILAVIHAVVSPDPLGDARQLALAQVSQWYSQQMEAATASIAAAETTEAIDQVVESLTS